MADPYRTPAERPEERRPRWSSWRSRLAVRFMGQRLRAEREARRIRDLCSFDESLPETLRAMIEFELGRGPLPRTAACACWDSDRDRLRGRILT